MPLQTSGPISASQIRDEFDGQNPFVFSEYYKAAASTSPTYLLIANPSVASETDTITITLTTTNVAAGTVIPYTITGISSADITQSLTGNFVVGTTNSITITPVADETTEGSETLILTLDNGATSISVVIADTSLTPPAVNLNTVTPTVINGQNGLQEITASDYISADETLIIPSDYWIWSDNVNTAALTIDIPCTIENNGKIIGKGGVGGHGNTSITNSSGTGLGNGGDGGPAIKINANVSNVIITNASSAYIAGGGGGGASSGVEPQNTYAGGGGGAGGGAGGDGGGVGTGNTGGSGGALNAAGNQFTPPQGVAGSTSAIGGEAGGYGMGSSSEDQRSAGGGGGGRILPGAFITNANAFFTPPGIAGNAGSDGVSGGNTGKAGGGGGWGANGGRGYRGTITSADCQGGAGGKAIEDSSNSYNLTNNGTVYGAT